MRGLVGMSLVLLCACGPAVGLSEAEPQSEGSSSSGPTSVDATSTSTTTMTASDTVDVDPPPVTTGPESTTGPSESSSSGIDPTLDCAGGFIPPGPCQDDCYRPIPGCKIDPIECSVWLNDCPDDEKCSAWANDGGSVWNATRCVPMDPEHAELGEPCDVEGSQYSGIDRCGRDARCWAVDAETNVGVCVARCFGTEDDPACGRSDEVCIVANDGVINVCVPACDPLLQNCGAGQGCYPAADAFACLPLDAGLVAGESSTCALQNDCAPGTTCSDDVGACIEAAEPCCVPYCWLAAPACPEGTVCVNALASDDIGVCEAE